MENNRLKLQLDADLALLPQVGKATRVFRVSVRAPISAETERPGLNLALVLDRSGSMGGDRLANVKRAALHVLDILQEKDRVALVTYDSHVDVVLPSSRVTDAVRKMMQPKIRNIRTGGSTNLGEGWFSGCREAAANLTPESVNRILLLTDGLANEGITDLEELAKHARELSQRGVSTSTFGVGDGFNEHLLEAMANQGSGNFYYIDSPQSIPEIFKRELNELTAVTAHGVQLEFNFPADWKLHVPGQWKVQFAAGKMLLQVGDLFSGQALDLYIQAEMVGYGISAQGFACGAKISGLDEAGERIEQSDGLVLRQADAHTISQAVPNKDVLAGFAAVSLADVSTEALRLKREGKVKQAQQKLRLATEQFSMVASAATLQSATDLSAQMDEQMEEYEMKALHFQNYNVKRGRE